MIQHRVIEYFPTGNPWEKLDIFVPQDSGKFATPVSKSTPDDKWLMLKYPAWKENVLDH